jgi:hypothetical protein
VRTDATYRNALRAPFDLRLFMDLPNAYANLRPIFISDAISMGKQRTRTGASLATGQARSTCHDDRFWNCCSDNAYRCEFGSYVARLARRSYNDDDCTGRTRRGERDPVYCRHGGRLRFALLRVADATDAGRTALMLATLA